MIDKIISFRKKIKKINNKKKYLLLPKGKKVYILDAPNYDNLGDIAITIAQINFLKKCGFSENRIKTFYFDEFEENKDFLRKYIKSDNLICGIGGGNLGNQWYPLELIRYSFIDAFPKNPIIIFPQTAFFTDDKAGERAIQESFDHYENHNNLTIVARENQSYDILNKLYKNPQIIMTPDIVLSATMKDYGVEVKKRKGALLVFRNDVEKAVSDDIKEKVIGHLNKNHICYKTTDMYADCMVNESNRLDLVKCKMQEFADSEIVITDRLHGMIFASLTETPCIVFSNYNHKVKGTYDWLKHLDYIRYVENTAYVEKYISELLLMKNCRFENKYIQQSFKKLEEVVRRYVN